MGEVIQDRLVRDTFEKIDRNHDGGISFEEFFEWWATPSTKSEDQHPDNLHDIMQKLKSKHFKQFMFNYGSLRKSAKQTYTLGKLGVGDVFGTAFYIVLYLL